MLFSVAEAETSLPIGHDLEVPNHYSRVGIIRWFHQTNSKASLSGTTEYPSSYHFRFRYTFLAVLSGQDRLLFVWIWGCTAIGKGMKARDSMIVFLLSRYSLSAFWNIENFGRYFAIGADAVGPNHFLWSSCSSIRGMGQITFTSNFFPLRQLSREIRYLEGQVEARWPLKASQWSFRPLAI